MKTGDSTSEKSKKDGNKANGDQDNGTPATSPANATSLDGSQKSKSSAKKKKRSNLFLRVGEKVGIVEQTRIAPEFMSEIEKYFKYYDLADNLV